MSLLGQLLIPWLIGFPALILSAEVDDRFAVFFGVSGMLLLASGIRVLTNDRDWSRFLASQRRGRFGYPPGRLPRLAFGAGVLIIGLGWTFGGLLGVLALLGLYDFPDS